MLFCFAALASTFTLQAAETDSDKLYAALHAGNLSELKALLDRGISANAADSRLITPLMYAAIVGSADAMRILIEHGADVNAQNAFGSTALMWSASDAQKVRLLLDHGADVNNVSKSGRTALMAAAATPGSAPVVRMLLERKADATPKDQFGGTALLAALQGNDTESIRMLLDAGADIHGGGAFLGMTPLMAAASSGNLAAVKLLLAKGARVNDVSPRENPLFKVKNGMVAAGAFTPLLQASTYGPPEVVKALIDAGADVNARDVRGMTPLMLAYSTDRYNPAIARILLDHGADPTIKSLAGETALDWAWKMGATRSAQSLISKQAAPIPAAAAPEVGTAFERSVQALEKGSATFFENGACVACHAQPPAHFAVAAARAKGIRVDEQAARERLAQMTRGLAAQGPAIMDRQGFTGGDGSLYMFEALGRSGYSPDRGTDFMVAELMTEQWVDGRWHGGGPARTPLSDGPFSRTAMAIRALKTYGMPGRAVEIEERVNRAAAWLVHAEPITTEDFDMRLLGATAGGVRREKLEQLSEPILARQRPDGGWGQRDELPTDAYATGMTLWSLGEAGILKPQDSVYRKGVQFLLSTQAADGWWHVASRAAKFQPYFESGVHYGHDQWISSMGTGWAASALALAIQPPLETRK